MLSVILGALFIIYFLIDVHYYIRATTIFIFGTCLWRKQRFLEYSTMYGIVLPSDGDFMFSHMNNARYLREYDFARMDHATRSGVIAKTLRTGGGFFVSAHTIRYRQPVSMFSRYKVLTRPAWWDKKYIYYEHRVETVSDGITRSVGYSKLFVRFDVEEFVKLRHPGVDKPIMPEDMRQWVESNKTSSERMENLTEGERSCKSKQG